MRWVLKWAGLGLAIVAATSLLSRRSPIPLPSGDDGTEEIVELVDPGVGPDASRAELDQRRQVLLSQLAAIERGGSRKNRKAGAQRRRRQRLMGQAVAVYQLLEKARQE